MNCGITFVAFGAKFVNEAIQAASSYRARMPQMPIALVTDAEIGSRPEFDHIIQLAQEPVQFPARYSGYYQKIRGIAATPFPVTLFVDGDTFCCEPVYELLVAAQQHGLVAVQAPRKVHTFHIDAALQARNTIPETNTGVIAFDRSRIDESFFDAWLELYRKLAPSEPERNFSDQSMFRALVTQQKITPMYMTYEYNVRVGLPAVLHGPVRILHGRPHIGMDKVASFVNLSTKHRIYIASSALVIMHEDTGEWEIRRFPNGELVRRISYLEFTRSLVQPPEQEDQSPGA